MLLVERNEWGVFYGFPKELQIGNETIIYQRDKDRFYQILEQKLKFKKTVVMKIEDLEHKISKINYNLKNLDLERKSSTLERKEEIENEVLLIEEKYQVLEKRLFEQAR